MTPEEFSKFDNQWKNFDENRDEGYILEVDLEYPDHLAELHNDYPLAPERIEIPEEWESPVLAEIKKKYNFKSLSSEKLVCNFLPKKNYCIHYLNLAYYLQLGLILKKVSFFSYHFSFHFLFIRLKNLFFFLLN